MTIKKWLLAVGSLLVLGLGPVAGQAVSQGAELITLKSKDGSVVLTGELQGFEAGYYNIVVVGMGLVRIDETLVDCQSSTRDCATLTNSF